jgi:hypothetical protein
MSVPLHAFTDDGGLLTPGLLPRLGDAAHEQDEPGVGIAQKEQKGAVGLKYLRRRLGDGHGGTRGLHRDRRCGRSLGLRFVHLDESLVTSQSPRQ